MGPSRWAKRGFYVCFVFWATRVFSVNGRRETLPFQAQGPQPWMALSQVGKVIVTLFRAQVPAYGQQGILGFVV